MLRLKGVGHSSELSKFMHSIVMYMFLRLIFVLQVDIGMLMASQWMIPCLAATACK